MFGFEKIKINFLNLVIYHHKVSLVGFLMLLSRFDFFELQHILQDISIKPTLCLFSNNLQLPPDILGTQHRPLNLVPTHLGHNLDLCACIPIGTFKCHASQTLTESAVIPSVGAQ